ncbi:hypothetical protein CSOJ01_03408 [Colletotrichum sojae]|uniref:Uncharacterized protein n=1 Tax=Colletotrichum sojae TaxID=2175907 RepID=A0A8H6JMS9_9PEZI|nr:hypothetical protein CSOJ01_03408 [Colletotrichum sojae]
MDDGYEEWTPEPKPSSGWSGCVLSFFSLPVVCAVVSPPLLPPVSRLSSLVSSNSPAAETKQQQEPGFTDEPQSSIGMIRYLWSGVSVGRVRHVCKVNPPQAQLPSQSNGGMGGPWGGALGQCLCSSWCGHHWPVFTHGYPGPIRPGYEDHERECLARES